MQYDPSKQGYNNYGNNYVNQYPPMSQTQFGAGDANPPNDAPPPYSQYPQQPSGYPAVGPGYPDQMPLHPQQGFVVAPVYRPWNNLVLTPITPRLRTFFIISGIFYLIWGILAMGLDVGIILHAYRTHYRGLWAGGYLLGSGIRLLIAACRVSYAMVHLIQMFVVGLCLCILALSLSIGSITTGFRCNDIYYWCDPDITLAKNLAIVILILFIVSIVHTIINIIVAWNAQKRVATTATASIATY